MERNLDGKVVVITGASQGLGKAIAEQCASLRAHLVLIARAKHRLDQVAQTLQVEDRHLMTVSCDISKAQQVEQAGDRIMRGMGQVDALVNNAGIPAPRSFSDTDREDWGHVTGVNLSGAFYMTRVLWGALTESASGYVINISGTAGLRGGSSPAYSSAKFGLTGLTRAIAANGSEHNLRATVLYPGSMDTGWRGAPIGTKPASEAMDPAEVARFIGYLLTTPQEFVINEAVLNPVGEPWL